MKIQQKRDKKKRNITLIIGVLILAVLFSVILMPAQTQEELQTELSQLEQELTDSGDSWLVINGGFKK
jgi:uncharacterized protein YpmB